MEPTSILPQDYLLSKYHSSSITGDREGQIIRRSNRQMEKMSKRGVVREKDDERSGGVCER